MSVPDADTLIRLAEILEVYVSELLGTKIENENVASDVAEQLSRINEQLAIKNRRSRRIWKIVAIILAVIVLVNIFIAVFFSVPDLNSNTQNNPLAISDETISIDAGRYAIQRAGGRERNSVCVLPRHSHCRSPVPQPHDSQAFFE